MAAEKFNCGDFVAIYVCMATGHGMNPVVTREIFNIRTWI
jgi:hypothetical protein